MTPFQRYGPAIAVYYASIWVMAVIFGVVAASGASPVPKELYGPLVYSIPAEAWAATQLTFGALATYGAVKQKRIPSVIGGFGLSVLFLFFAAAALQAGASGTLLVSMALPASAMVSLAATLAWRG